MLYSLPSGCAGGPAVIPSSSPSSPGTAPVSWREFQGLPEDPGWTHELVRGRVVREPRPAPLHARVVTTLAWLLEGHVRVAGGGVVLVEAGYLLSREPDTIRGPDLSFVPAPRVPPAGYNDPGFWELAPDLAVEVLSPGNRASEVQEKVLEYLDAGSRLVWVVDPRLKTLTVHTPGGDARILMGDAEVTGGEVLPAFAVPLQEIFPG